MLCEVIAYILSRQRLSAKTFVTGCVFYALQDRLSLWMLCDTSGVGKLSASLSHGFSLRASPAVTHGVSPLGTVSAGWEVSLPPLIHGFTLRASPAVKHGVSPSGTVGAGWEISLFSPSLLSTYPRVHPSGITRGYAWCVPSEDSGWTMSCFFSYQEKQTLWRSVFSLSFVLICRAQKYNKGVG